MINSITNIMEAQEDSARFAQRAFVSMMRGRTASAIRGQELSAHYATKAREALFEAIGAIDMTPTWSAILPWILTALEDGSPTAQASARLELERMARIADDYVALRKGQR